MPNQVRNVQMSGFWAEAAARAQVMEAVQAVEADVWTESRFRV